MTTIDGGQVTITTYCFALGSTIMHWDQLCLTEMVGNHFYFRDMLSEVGRCVNTTGHR